MSKQRIHIGAEDADRGFERFTGAWERATKGEMKETEIHLNFEDLSMLLAVITPKRLEILKTLRQNGPRSVRSLAKQLGRDYKNVHVDTGVLEDAGLLERTASNKLMVPWDVIDAHLSLVA